MRVENVNINSNDKMIVRFAKYSDISSIMFFIKQYWSEKHILANKREFFEYQYVDGEDVHFVITENKETNEIEGVLGFIPYDNERDVKRDIFLALWKVRQGNNLFAGMEMLYFLEREGRCTNTYCVGINKQTFSIYKYMKKNVAKLEQYYLLNTMLKEYRIAEVKKKNNIIYPSVLYDVERITTVDQLDMEEINNNEFLGPHKSVDYIAKRYFNHPTYEYEIFGIRTNMGIAYIVGREQKYNDAKVFRIVELWGFEKNIGNIGAFLVELLNKNNYEYIDCYEYGISEQCMKKIGFLKVEDDEINIFPNYFEPFEKQNVDIYIFTPRGIKTRIFKGDGDQDRPSFY